MKNVMAAASEAEIGALFHNGQETAHMRNVLKAMGHEQTGPTRITTDNSTADGFANKQAHQDPTIQSHGHAFLLGARQSQTRPICHILAKR
jgi:hypothetical protein